MPFKTELVTDEAHGARVETSFNGIVSKEDVIHSIEDAIALLEQAAGPLPVVALIGEKASFFAAFTAVLQATTINRLRHHRNLKNQQFLAVDTREAPDRYWEMMKKISHFIKIVTFDDVDSYLSHLAGTSTPPTNITPPAEAQE